MSSLKPAKKTAMVTGVAGFIGHHLAMELLKRGHRVLGVDNFDPLYPRSIKERNLEKVRQSALGASSDFVFLEKNIVSVEASAFRDESIDSVFHLAALAGVRPSLAAPKEYLTTNVLGTASVLEFCRVRQIKDLIFASSSSVYGEHTQGSFTEQSRTDCPISPYAASKVSAEALIQSYAHLYSLRVAILRYFTVYGPGQRPDLAIHKFVSRIVRGQAIELYGDGSTARDYTFVSDAVGATLLAHAWLVKQLRSGVEIFNVGGGRVVCLSELVQLIKTHYAGVVNVSRSSLQSGDVSRTCADLSKSRRILGYDPKVTMESGIAQFIRWYLETNSNQLPATDPNALIHPSKQTNKSIQSQ